MEDMIGSVMDHLEPDGKETIKYMRGLNDNEMVDLETMLNNVKLSLGSIEFKKQSMLKEFNERKRHLREEYDNISEQIERGEALEEGEYFYTLDPNTGKKIYYNSDKEVVYARNMTPNEKYLARQMKITD